MHPSSPSHSYGSRPNSGARSGSYSNFRFSRSSRPSSGGFGRGSSHSRFGGGRGRGRGGPKDQRIDVSRFINKAVITETEEIFVPMNTFADFPVYPPLKRNIITKGYVNPTPIQDKAIPHILKGQDVVGIANTGTGKTAAFLIPLIDKVVQSSLRENVLVMVPTRELAIQIQEELNGFVTGMGIYSVCCVGGANIVSQIRQLSRRYNFLIGTPGRLRDLIERKRIDLSTFNTVVLDEADRMLDMGFIGEMRYMLGLMPTPRHTLFFSATMSPDIERLIHDFLKNPVSISVKTRDTSKSVDQDVVRVPHGKDKFTILTDLLGQSGFDKVLVFGRTKHGVEKLTRELQNRGFKAESIHGDKSHGQRQKALTLFKQSHANILVATDVAARGLDIRGVSHVINYELPATYEDYVHRIGRTGRAGQKGCALTFVS